MSRSDRNRTLFAVALDLVMLGLIVANLVLIVFDWMFLNASFRAFLQQVLPNFHAFYNQNIHANFFYIDLAFVSVFLVEIGVRWGVAVWRETYHRWFFYPFVHWYDVLGCIPISSFRFLRILRVFAVIPKMQRTGLIDLKQTYLYQRYLKYRDILTEEITDRVTVNILSGIQDGVRDGNPVTERIVREVIVPQRQALAVAFTHRLQEAAAAGYAPYRDDLRTYVEERVQEAVVQNSEIGTLARIPGVGRPVIALLERAISDITFHVIDEMLRDVSAPDNDELLAEITERSASTLVQSQHEEQLTDLLQHITIDAIELIKEQVSIQQWKLEEVVEKQPQA